MAVACAQRAGWVRALPSPRSFLASTVSFPLTMPGKSQLQTDDKPARKRARTRAPKADVRIAAIDIGSNSIRQTVADVSPDGTIRVVDEMKAAPRLGAGISKTGKLSTHAMAAALAALNRMSALAKQLGAKRRRVVATSAVREASNGPEWLALVRKEAGMRVSVLD